MVVLNGAAARPRRPRGGGRENSLPPPALDQGLPGLDGRPARLERLPPAVAGPPDPGLLLRQRAHFRLRRRTDQLPRVRGPATSTGSGRPGHVVLVRAVALRYHGLAG